MLAGPFTNLKVLRKPAQGFTVFVGIYSLVAMLYLVLAPFYGWKGDTTLEVVAKLHPVANVEEKVFPGFLNFLIFTLLALFGKHLGKPQKEAEEQNVEDDMAINRDTKQEESDDVSQKSTKFIREDTLRGKTRKLLFRTFLFVNWAIEIISDLLIVHCGKLALLALFLVSIIKPNLINLGFFLLFLVFAVASHEQVKTYWLLPIMFNCFVLTLIYATDVFVIQVDQQENLDLIGIGI